MTMAPISNKQCLDFLSALCFLMTVCLKPFRILHVLRPNFRFIRNLRHEISFYEGKAKWNFHGNFHPVGTEPVQSML
jgi:hypothetical protein